jgi:replicative DNA helicase
LNPRHLILETSVLPTELRTLISYYNFNRIKLQDIKNYLNYIRKGFKMKQKQEFIKKNLPHNFLAEQMILNCLILNSETIKFTIKLLPIEAFYFINHQQIYKILKFMHENKLLIDSLSLTIFLQENNLLKKIGGIKVLIELTNQSSNLIYLEDYIKLVKDKFLRRSLIKLGYQISNCGYITNIPLEKLLFELDIEISDLLNHFENKSILSSAELLNLMFSELKERFLNPKLPGLSSGFPSLDNLTQGFQKSDLIILAGRPSVGKTALSLSLALNIIKNSRLPVIFFSLEMSKEQIMYRILSVETMISQIKLKNGQLDQNDWLKLTKIIKIIAKLPFFIDETASLSIQELRLKLKAISLKQTEIGAVIIDYLQLMETSDSKTGNRVQELSYITRSLKNLSKEFNIPIIALSQLSRNVDNRIDQKPILSDLRESGSIEQDADLVLMLYRLKTNTTKEMESFITDIIIAKQRNGPIGTVQLEFEQNYAKFTELKVS